MYFIRKNGIEKFVEQQKERMKLLETMIENFDDGRSRSFFCKSAVLIDMVNLKTLLNDAIRRIKTDKIKPNDIKSKAKILRQNLNEVSSKEN